MRQDRLLKAYVSLVLSISPPSFDSLCLRCKGLRFLIIQSHTDRACPVCLPDIEGQSVSVVSETWRSFCSLRVGKRQEFVRQFPLLANWRLLEQKWTAAVRFWRTAVLDSPMGQANKGNAFGGIAFSRQKACAELRAGSSSSSC